MRFYVSCDIEGIVGVTSHVQGAPGGHEYEKARAWMTRSARSVCEAALSSGATELVLADGHGNGMNLLLDELPENVSVVRSWPRGLLMMEGIQRGSFDGAFLIGYHSSATEANGVLAHTIFGRVIAGVRLNGRECSETLISAATAGYFGIPVLMVSGDDQYVANAQALLGNVHGVAVKRAVSYQSVETVLPEKAYALLHEGATRAIENRGNVKPFVVPGPFKLEITFRQHLTAEVLSLLPICERTGATSVVYRCDDFLDLVRFLVFVTFYSPTPGA